MGEMRNFLGKTTGKWLHVISALIVVLAPLAVPMVADATPTISQFPIPTGSSQPLGITTGPDGNLWFAEGGADVNKIGKVTPDGTITEYSIAPYMPMNITKGSDGNLWFTILNSYGPSIGRMTPSGVFTQFSLNGISGGPIGITSGPDGNLWMTESGESDIVRFNPNTDAYTQFPIPSGETDVMDITSGSDGNVWFTESNNDMIGRITPSGVVTEYKVPTSNSYPYGITLGADGNLWFTEFNSSKIGKVTPEGAITEFSLPPIGGGPGTKGIISGSDGNLWFADTSGMGEMTTGGVFSQNNISSTDPSPSQYITSGPDGNIWYTFWNPNGVSSIGRFNIANAPPQVAPIPYATINEGDTYTAPGSFTDPDSSSWTATVDYGDGSGVQSLPLSGNDFSLSHTYPAVGNYTVTVKITDNQGATGTSATSVLVNNVAPTVTGVTVPSAPIQINSPVTVSAGFSDPGSSNETYSATVDWGDNTSSPGSITGGTVTADHTYTSTGVYPVTVTVTDNNGGSGSLTAQSYVVVYDPSGGFVTGGGWINSPQGAYTSDPSLTGKATFGFVSKYLKGANVPSGQTEFQFQVANFDFRSTSYDWLVIAGSKAQYKGTGTINDLGSYQFMLTAIDGSPDTFRLKVWDPATNMVIYDNQLGSSDNSDPTTAIGGGDIVIHQ